MLRNRVCAALMLVTLLLSACTAIKDAVHMRTPDFALESLRLTGLGMDSVDLAFDIGVQNPNPVPVTLEAIQYELWLEGTRFLTGRQDSPHDISALGKSTIVLPLTLDYSDLRQSYAALEGQDSTAYELRARLTFQIPVLGYRSLNLRRSGRLPILRPPRLAVADIRLQKLDLGGADVVLQLQVTNPNAFSLGVRQLDYELSVSEHSWATGQLAQPLQLKPRGKQVIEVPMSVDLSQLGFGVYSALSQNKPIVYHLKGSIDLNTGLTLLPCVRLPLDLSGTVSRGGH